MKLGFVSAILSEHSYEEMIDVASRLGFTCVEAACWPQGKAERRYSGVTHIDVERVLTEEDYREHILAYAAEKGVEISALAFYPNTLDPNPNRRRANTEHLARVIRASARLGINLVTTFIGRDQRKTVEDNLAITRQVWPPLLRLAEEEGVRIAIENCPMLFGPDQWPAGQNLMTSPANWEKVFSLLDSPNLGINYDPSHFIWQHIDYIKPLYAFREKIFHVHFKDIKLYPEKLDQVGVLGYPLDYMAPKLPGLGDVNWGRFVSALTDIGYDGYACIEVEDRAFEGTPQRILDSLALSRRYMEPFVI